MGEFKAGDSAMIKKAVCRENIGKVVRLIDSTNKHQIRYDDTKVVFNPERLLVWSVEGDLTITDSFGFKYTTSNGMIPEQWLMPLDGHVPDDDDQLAVLDIGRGLLKSVLEFF